MKKDIHPAYKQVTFACACGATFTAGSTIKGDFHTEICSKCHPFYTGKQKLVDSSGRVDKFMAKMKKAQAAAEKNVKKVDNEDAEDIAKETAENAEMKAEMENVEEVKEEVPTEENEMPEAAEVTEKTTEDTTEDPAK